MGYDGNRRKGGLVTAKAPAGFRMGWAVMCLIALLTLTGCGAGRNGVHSEGSQEQKGSVDFIGRASPQSVIPGLDKGMTPQGIGCDEKTGLVYITSYAMGGLPSVISAVSLETGEQTAEYRLFDRDGTPFTGHVGGIAVTEDRIYFSVKQDLDGSYSVGELPLAELPITGSHDVTVDRTIPLPVSPSFLSYSQEVLWVGNFYHPSAGYVLSPEIPYTTASADGEYGCYILGYRLDTDGLTVPAGETYPVPDLVLAVPDRIQGMVRLADGVMLSQSYGRKKKLDAAGVQPDCGRSTGCHAGYLRSYRSGLCTGQLETAGGSDRHAHVRGALYQSGGHIGAVRVRLQPLQRRQISHRPHMVDRRWIRICHFYRRYPVGQTGKAASRPWLVEHDQIFSSASLHDMVYTSIIQIKVLLIKGYTS